MALVVKDLLGTAGVRDMGSIPWEGRWQPTPVFLPGESHGQRGLVGYSSWGHKESDVTEQLNNHNITHICI